MIADSGDGFVAVVTVVAVTVVGGEEEESVVVEIEFFEKSEDVADCGVEAGHHASPFLGSDGPVLVFVRAEFGDDEGPVRNGGGEVEEEGLLPISFGMPPNEVQRAGVDEIEGVLSVVGVFNAVGADAAFGVVLALLLVIVADVLGEFDLGSFLPEVGGVVGVGLALVEVAEEFVEALICGDSVGLAGEAEAPLAEEAGGVAGLVKNFGDGDVVLEQAFAVTLVGVAADAGVAGVEPLHEAGPRRRADRVAGVGVGEAHALAGEAVDVRSEDLFLAVAAKVAPAEIIGEDEDDVGLGALGQSWIRRKCRHNGG